jgi:AAA domain
LENRIVPHPDFETYTVDEIIAHKTQLENDISFGTKHGADKIFISWLITERHLCENTLARRNGFANGHTQAQESFWPEPLEAGAFLTKTVEGERWLWEDALPQASTSMIAGQPRTGKSTLALNLTLAISRGVKFLGRECTQANGCYVSIDNSDAEFRAIVDRLGVVAGDKLWIHTGKVPDRAVDWITDQTVKKNIKFLVIDTYQRFFAIKNINDAQECIDKMSPLDFRAKDLGIHICYLHHAGKGDSKTGDPTQTAALGSIAIKGMVPWYFQYSRVGSGQRILSSDFRGGRNFDQAYLEQDRKSGWTVLGGNLEDALIHDCTPKILDLLTDEPELTEGQIQGAIEARAIYVSKALRRLFNDDQIGRSGTGKRGDAFKYFKQNRLGDSTGTELRKVSQLRDYIK